MEEATFLTKFASDVSIVHRRDTLRASKIMQDRAVKNPKISFIWDSVVDKVYGDPKAGGVTGVRLKNLKTGETQDFKTDGLFVAIGHEPNTKLFVGQLDLDPAGYILTHDGTKTNVLGVFACGDVQDHVYRQAVTAAGTGCMAAIDTERFQSRPINLCLEPLLSSRLSEHEIDRAGRHRPHKYSASMVPACKTANGANTDRVITSCVTSTEQCSCV
jgi:thioredoxin reductase